VHFYDQALRALENVPGVMAATISTSVPYGDGDRQSDFSIEGRPAPAPGELRRAQVQNISPNYFQVMHIALRAGRSFSERDSPESPRVAVIGDALARRYFPGENALGKHIRFDTDESKSWLTIVGIAEDVRYDWFDKNPPPAIYRPYRQATQPYTYLALRSSGNPMQLVAAVRRQMATVDADLPLAEIKTLERVIFHSVLGLSYVAVMMAVLGAIALVLACVGVYGVMAYGVSERTREIGIRMALGAKRADVLRMIIGRGMLVTAAGLAIGFTISFPLAHLLASLIFGVSASDWPTFAGTSFALAAAAFLASYVPARRATKVDPMEALRHE
jgi:putative ABC transport system permease protein